VSDGYGEGRGERLATLPKRRLSVLNRSLSLSALARFLVEYMIGWWGRYKIRSGYSRVVCVAKLSSGGHDR
jgi:hypothetical protein